MPLKLDPLEEPSINLASMLDIVMLLLMFFMIGTQFKDQERQYDIQLPLVADATALSGQPDEIVLNIAVDGTITVSGQRRSLPEVEEWLGGVRRNFPGQSVIIRGDGRGEYQHIMDVMAAVRRAGIRNLSLANKPA